MGGGDLNLKKSWHPQTLKNVERVWKAEQKHEAEKKKIEELQRELREERAREEMQRYAEDSGALKKKSDRLDWMYQGPGSMVNKEEYLLGRPIDKYATDKMVDEESGPSSDTGLLPGSIFSATGSALDMASKIREDPLFMIRKREEEKKREVLTNPMKMKMIREILQKNLDKTDKKKKDKKKKHKKHRRSSSSDNEHHKKKHEKCINSSSTSVPKKLPGYGLKVKDSPSIIQQQHSSSSDPAKRSHKARPRSRSGSHPRTVVHQSHKDVRREDSRHRRSRSTSQSPPKRSKMHSRYDDKVGNVEAQKSYLPRGQYHRRPYSNQSRKLSAEELERRRQEMMEDAKWNDKARQCNIKRYKEDDEMEQELERKDTKDGKFLHKIKLQSTATSSLEDRVKRNIHSIQRTPAALEKNFMRK